MITPRESKLDLSPNREKNQIKITGRFNLITKISGIVMPSHVLILTAAKLKLNIALASYGIDCKVLRKSNQFSVEIDPMPMATELPFIFL